MQPTDHISIFDVHIYSPNKNSGARYHNVTTMWVYGLKGSANFLAKPKSHTFKSPLLSTNKFEVFKSL